MREDIKQIRQVLKGYSKIKQDLSSFNSLPSPSFDSTGSSSSLNHTENKFVYHAELSNRLYQIEKAVADIKDSKQRFILNKYIIEKKYTRKQMCDRYKINPRTFNRMKNLALIEFAKNYGMKQLLEEMSKPQVYE